MVFRIRTGVACLVAVLGSISCGHDDERRVGAPINGTESVGGAYSAGGSVAGDTGGASATGSTSLPTTGGTGTAVTSTGAAGSATGGVSATGGASQPSTGGTGSATGGTSADITGKLSTDAQAELKTLQAAIASTKTLDATSLTAQHPVTHSNLDYDPLTAKYMDLIAASPLALSTDENRVLSEKGFVISDRQRFCSFYDGLDSIYAADLPVYISADAILESVHRSYDTALKTLETSYLLAEVKTVLETMRNALTTIDASADSKRDADLYLAVPYALLTGSTTNGVAGASTSDISDLVTKAQQASGTSEVQLFGETRSIDWSQFAPRGHYNDNLNLQRYFRAMMWLGRIPLNLIATDSYGNQALMRRQVDGALLLNDLLGTDGLARWANIEQVLSAFIGENDNLTPADVSKLLADLGVKNRDEAATLDDTTLADTILKGGYGFQRIASQIMVNGVDRTLPLDRSYLIFGQRYIVDSHVFSNVVYDRVQGGSVRRMMPNPLDVAYAALGNDDALPLLSSDLTNYRYAPDLESMRLLVDAHETSYWGGSLYTRWLDALRALSPSTALAQRTAMPEIAQTEPWGRRLLNAQLGSWAELRHDTLLYAKQSYTGVPSCDYPDAYVDPYPEFFARLAKMADKGTEVANLVSKVLGTSQVALLQYFANLSQVASMLSSMASEELTGAPFTQAQLDFVNRAVRYKQVDVVCAKVKTPAGWYVDLFLNAGDINACQPTIADVHTQPADESGNTVGRILHVGTGYPRMMVTTVNTCTGPKAYVGVVFAYHERTTENWKRLTDSDWSKEVSTTSPADVAWMTDLVVR